MTPPAPCSCSRDFLSLFSEVIFVRDRRHQVPRPGTTVTGTLGDPGDLGPMAFFSVALNQWCGFIDTGHPMKPKLVSTHLKNNIQIGSLPQIGVNINNI